MGKYRFEYESVGLPNERTVAHSVNLNNETMDTLLEEFTHFVQAVSYGSGGLINTFDEDEFEAVEEFIAKYRRNKYDNIT
jgi:hypothetical protein